MSPPRRASETLAPSPRSPWGHAPFRRYLASRLAAEFAAQMTAVAVGAALRPHRQCTGKGTFYLYFSSKEAVRSALGERYAEAHLARTSAAVAQARAWEGKLLAWVQASADFYLDSIALHDMLFYQARSPTREGLVENKVTDQLEALLAAGNAARAWSIGDPRAAAVFLFAGVHAVVDGAVNRAKRIHRPRLLARLEGLSRAVVRGL
jgi:AcrR family transcriptional regulator